MRTEHGNRRAVYHCSGDGKTWIVITSQTSIGWDTVGSKLIYWKLIRVPSESYARSVAADWIAGGVKLRDDENCRDADCPHCGWKDTPGTTCADLNISPTTERRRLHEC